MQSRSPRRPRLKDRRTERVPADELESAPARSWLARCVATAATVSRDNRLVLSVSPRWTSCRRGLQRAIAMYGSSRAARPDSTERSLRRWHASVYTSLRVYSARYSTLSTRQPSALVAPRPRMPRMDGMLASIHPAEGIPNNTGRVPTAGLRLRSRDTSHMQRLCMCLACTTRVFFSE